MDSETTLPFDKTKQDSIIGHLILNERFFKSVHNKIKPNWFLEERNSFIYKTQVSFYEKYNRFPHVYELKSTPEIMALDLKEKNIVLTFINKALSATQHIRLDVIKTELTEWLHTVILMNGMLSAQDLFNRKQIKQCHEKLMVAVKEVTHTTFDGGNSISFLNFQDYLLNAEKERQDALTTGLKILDEALVPGGMTNGGLLRGDTTLVMGAVNRGKTSCLVTMAMANVKVGKSVLFMTHEGKPETIRLQMLANYLDCSISDIFNLYKTKAGIERLERATQHLEKYLKYIPYNKAGNMIIEEVVPIIRNNQETWAANHEGEGFDLLVSDYPAILSTELARKGTLQKRNIDQIIYNNYVQLALEYGFHSLLAIQTNREGSRINRRLTSQDRFLEMEDVSESWGPVAEASNVITINRSPDAEKLDIVTYRLVKSRSNETGINISAKSNFKHCITHSNEMGAIKYKSSETSEERIHTLISNELYKNTTVPDTLMTEQAPEDVSG